MGKHRYPCTGKIRVEGFGAFLEENIKASRHNLQSFADELKKEFDAEYVTLVNSGSSANLVAAMALAERLRAEAKPLEAVTAAFTFPTTLSALSMAGFSVRIIDTEENGFNMCPAALEKALGEKPASLVCVTHFLGFAADMEKLLPLARKHGAFVLQDACETMDLRGNDGKQLHTLGDLTTWSFYHPHHFSSYGGGAVVAPDKESFRLCDSVAHWGRACCCHIDPAACTAPAGWRHNFTYVRTGINVEMSELNACFGRFQLRDWEEMEKKRKLHYAILFDALQGVPGITTWQAPENSGSPFVFPIAYDTMTGMEAAEKLGKHDVEARTLMGGTMIDQPAFTGWAHDGNKNARALSERACFVGIHQTLKTEDIRTVAGIIATELKAAA